MTTASADSIAASDPKPPIATPTSAERREGESFIPSPTKTVLPVVFISASLDNFWSGINSPYVSSIPTSSATFLQISALSPLSIISFLTFKCFKSAKASFVVSLIVSAISIEPTKPLEEPKYNTLNGELSSVTSTPCLLNNEAFPK